MAPIRGTISATSDHRPGGGHPRSYRRNRGGCLTTCSGKPTTVFGVSAFPCSDDILPESVTLLPLPDVAQQLGTAVTRVHQMLRDHQIIAIRREGIAGIPKDFFDADGEITKHLPGLITVMRDAKYSDEEILQWIYLDDESLPGRPIDALHGPLAREVIRRAAADPF